VGYDMYSVKPIPNRDHAGAKFTQHGPANDEKFPYYRLNIFGMQAMRVTMRDADVLDEDADIVEVDGGADLAARSPLPGKVPVYKFCSNDAWVVTPEECAAIAEALTKWADERAESLLSKVAQAANVVNEDIEEARDFAAYNFACVDLEGYTVC